MPWRSVLIWSIVGTVLATGLGLWNLRTSEEVLGPLVTTVSGSAAAPTLERELGATAINDGGAHDGAYYYVVARRPWDLTTVAESLDAPRYRLQRIVFPVAARVAYPFGDGTGLMWSLFAVGVIGIFVGCAATGALSAALRGPAWPAVVFGAMPGAMLSLRISVSDPLALALALWAVVLAIRGRWVWAIVLGCLAVLTKEPLLLVLVGYAVHRWDRRAALLVAVPAAVAAAWAAVLFVAVPAGHNRGGTLALPFSGLIESARFWAQGYEPLGLLAVLVGLVLAGAALAKRGLGHPLAWAVAIQLAFLLVVHVDTLGPERNGSRLLLPVAVLAVVMLATPTAPARRSEVTLERSVAET